jgi:hypothetical protein
MKGHTELVGVPFAVASSARAPLAIGHEDP